MIEFILSAPFVLSAAIVIAVAIAVLLEFEKDGWATTLFSLGTALTIWAYKSEIWDVVSNNPMSTVCFIIAYIVVGLIWSLIKWKVYIGKKVNLYEDAKLQFEKKVGTIKNNWAKWTSTLQANFGGYFSEYTTAEVISEKIIPKASEKKSLIVSWIGYWPMSLFATLLNNPFRRFFEWVYSITSGLYDKMGNSAAKKIAAGLDKGETENNSKTKKELING